jgi:FtsZ-binding cell division protein ZapB
MAEFSLVPEVTDESRGESQTEHAEKETGTLAFSLDEFSSLEDRILRAVNLVKRERLARAAADERVTQVEAKFNEQVSTTEQLQREVDALRGERDQVRQRVERLLAQLDTLEL